MYYVEFLDGTNVLTSDYSFLEEEIRRCIEISNYNPDFFYHFDGEQLITIKKPSNQILEQNYSSKQVFSAVIDSV